MTNQSVWTEILEASTNSFIPKEHETAMFLSACSVLSHGEELWHLLIQTIISVLLQVTILHQTHQGSKTGKTEFRFFGSSGEVGAFDIQINSFPPQGQAELEYFIYSVLGKSKTYVAHQSKLPSLFSPMWLDCACPIRVPRLPVLWGAPTEKLGCWYTNLPFSGKSWELGGLFLIV